MQRSAKKRQRDGDGDEQSGVEWGGRSSLVAGDGDGDGDGDEKGGMEWCRRPSFVAKDGQERGRRVSWEWLPASNVQEWSLSLAHSAGRARRRAVAGVHGYLDVVVANGEGDHLLYILVEQLGSHAPDASASAAQQIVSLITSLALKPHNGFPSTKQQDVLHILISLIVDQDSQPAKKSSALKLQACHSLSRIAHAKPEIDLSFLATKLIGVLPFSSARLRAQILALLVAIAKQKHGKEGGGEVAILQEDSRMGTHADYVLQALNDCMRDPHPCVREAALHAMSKLHRKGYSLTRELFQYACALLQDSYEDVRIQALQVVQLWIEFIDDMEEDFVCYDANFTFLQVCARLTDVSMKVRVKACSALGKMKRVSEDILLHTLNKKSLFPSEKEKERLTSLGIITKEKMNESAAQEEDIDILLKSISGVFVQAIEDEFFEVRQAAVLALARLNEGSKKLQCYIQDLLVDMLNDDSRFVRMEILQVLQQMACKDRVVVNEDHLHMLHEMLEDSNLEMRSAMRMLLTKTKLQSLGCFRLMLQSLLNHANKHEKDNGIIHVFYSLGRFESNYVQISVEELLKEVKALLNSDAGLDKLECKALIALFVAAAQSSLIIPSLIPGELLSCLRLMMDSLPQKAQTSRLELLGPKLHVFNPISLCHNINCYREECTRLMPKSYIQQVSDQFCKDGDNLHIKNEQSYDLLTCMVNTMNEVKSLMDVGLIHAAHNVLSGCRRNLKQLSERAKLMKSPISFLSLYLEYLFSLMQGWAFLQSSKSKSRLHASSITDKVCHKLQSLVMRMKHTFCGHSKQQRLLLLELGLIPYIWRIASEGHGNSNRYHSQLRSFLVSAINLSQNGLSHFMQEVEGYVLTNLDDQDIVRGQKKAQELALRYWPKISSDLQSVNELQAEITTLGVDFEHPVCFLPGLPLGISLNVALNDVTTDCRIWICSSLGTNGPQYTFLDRRDKIDIVNCITVMLKFYGTPNVAKCTMKIVLLLECPLDEPFQIVPKRGPIGHLLPISDEKIVHLISGQALHSQNRNLI